MMEKTYKQIAQELNLKERAAKLGTHREVAEKMGYKKSTFRKMIYGEIKASAPFLEKLAELEKKRLQSTL